MSEKKPIWKTNLILILLVVVLAAAPLFLLPNAEFGGADGEAEGVVEQVDPGFEAWFEPIMEPTSGEVESLLFALQAAVGAGVLCFCIGRMTANKGGKKE